ncbi:hypothetical protein LTR91_003237 [Friedmanniomyces endolithicus]|uniref:3-dehydroquinate synthase domain-containing protein n=1 Tax=Friedmanniomyces endolithicus TaxID=329885 RepID=A0AAN6KWV4_9PEZI|nr:hypothetical protein LTR94_002762 [Friedmanniomyces endolithicus]KAK0781486.1 hypothetical protein LTR59_012473 [Friedmanniomyces endolithicus]KAK0800692.1 hypothetical protein LTR38_007126 [Friedmanniomyces endolithicus]KAK0852252.1 hypothetical protein LTR03_003513 [Friedmanniomyces endolithicus]KAK0882079.1 hypothetical protein LTR87_004034 [Friedmanniomyces endolithicus]
MSDMQASVTETKAGFHVEGYEKIEYDFSFVDGVFDKSHLELAQKFERWNRCLAIMDLNIFNLYGKQMQEYFTHHNIELKIHKTMIGEKAKSIETYLSIVDSMNEFGEQPTQAPAWRLFACASYKRNTNYIRIPTTVIGLIDASVSIKVAVNYGNYKNRLGAYHAPMHTFLDFRFLRSLPEAQIRNGFAELIKISSCAHLPTFDLLDKYCEELISTGFGRADGAKPEVKEAADKINRSGIYEMLKLETPNLHEIGLDRVIAYGHTWSPLHELVPEVPLRHGHAISIDMAYSATLANERGLLSDEEHRRILNLFSRAGLSMDHKDFNEEVLERATEAILKTRDGKLRAAVPHPLGSCIFLNDVSKEDMAAALRKHKQVMKGYPRKGEGLEAFVDASDTGYTLNEKSVEKETNGAADGLQKMVINDDAADSNGGLGAKDAVQHAAGVDADSAITNGDVNGKANGTTNGTSNGTNATTNGNTNGTTNGTNGH